MNAMTEVTKDKFFASVYACPHDMHPHILPGRFPYTSVFKLRHGGGEFGRIVGKATGHGPAEYFLAEVRP